MIIVGNPQGHCTGIVQFLWGGHEDYTMTVWFTYDLHKVFVRVFKFYRQKKLSGDREESKHRHRSLKPPTMPDKSTKNRRQINCRMPMANVTET